MRGSSAGSGRKKFMTDLGAEVDALETQLTGLLRLPTVPFEMCQDLERRIQALRERVQRERLQWRHGVQFEKA